MASSSLLNFSTAHNYFIDAYFIAYNSSYPIVHERSFRERYLQKTQIPSNDTWHVVYYMVLAIGEWISGHNTEQHSLYYEAARSRLNFDILESGNISVVQALLLLGNYLQKRDRPNTAYNFIGIAYRVALGLGLHRELPKGHGVDSFALQQRRLMFWTLYCFDSGFSMTTGRPTMVSDTFIDIRKPTNIDESVPNTPSDTLREVDYPTTASAIIAQARLAVIANKVYNKFLSVQACSDVEDLVATMEQTIRNWRSSLPWFFFDSDVPQWFLGPRQVVLWKADNLQIALLLASQRNQVEDHEKMSISYKCQTVAIRTIVDISQFCLDHQQLVNIGLSWYAVYFLLHGILALGLHQLVTVRKNGSTAHSHRREELPESAESAIARARECLQMLGRTNRAALRTLQIADRIEDTLADRMRGANGRADSTGHHPLPISSSNSHPLVPGPELTFASNGGPRPLVGETDAKAEQNNQYSTSQTVFPETTPEGPDADFIMNEWVSTADPSLHFFFDNGTAELENVFEGMQGFPNVLDADNFGYMTSTTTSVRIPENNGTM
jgi:transcriptional regulatory protein GAL4